MELVARAQAIEDRDPDTAKLLRDASDEVDRLRGRLNEATDSMIRTAYAQAEKAEHLRKAIFPLGVVNK